MSRNRIKITLGIALVTLACSRTEQVTGPAEIEVSEAQSKVKANTEPLDNYVYGCDGVGVRELGYSQGRFCAKFYVGEAYRSAVHLAAFSLPGQQRRSQASKFYRPEDQTLTICLDLPSDHCGTDYQIDAGCGTAAPENANYSNEFINSWYLRVEKESCGGSEKTPTPVASMTPTGTPSGRPTPTPTKTPTPRLTPTPTSRPFPTPTPSCQSQNLPSVSWQGWNVQAILSGTVQVHNQGPFEVQLRSASNFGKYTSNNPDYIKVTKIKNQACGSSGFESVSYQWQGHSSEYWWIYVTFPGGDFKSPMIQNTFN